ncbi:Rieske (2Fe-2S) protein [Streptomyces lasalocidi]|uniref:Cytochrome bc1 complex Rieske iron-sulfur subunit n=1 Tax=Streptomyces lasalocidi TaxID=324833 RepID=A0A4U5WGD5_STRLS|nr:Rieske (2Fe-2S) protein [Streptomyces lasalocidi]TKT00021.1 Rieske (2Fe-2S) protein [Streptomyces lasalocidi]
MTHPAPRRTVLLATGAAALAAGCGGGSGGDGSSGGSSGGSSEGAPSAGASGGRTLARTSEIPVGGGKVFADRKVVVTQPDRGAFKAFSAICTHQGCTVATVADGTINCPCHGSEFRITDGSVAGGPATRPLPAERITVQGDSIELA